MPEDKAGYKPANKDETDASAIADIDKLVHEPARLSILAVLNAVEAADFVFVLRHTGLTRGNLSSHMSKLQEAGYIDVSKEFVDKVPRTLLSISEKGRSAIEKYTASMRRFLESIENRGGE